MRTNQPIPAALAARHNPLIEPLSTEFPELSEYALQLSRFAYFPRRAMA